MAWLRSLINLYGRYLRLPRNDRRLAVQAALILPLTILGQRLLGFNRCRKFLDGLTSRLPAEPLGDTAGAEEGRSRVRAAVRTSEIVHAIAVLGPFRANCLHRSLTLCCLLRARGIPGDLRVGVTKASGQFEAHAWVEHLGRVLNDRADVAVRFPSFDRPLLPREMALS